jgi:hypothetical protein
LTDELPRVSALRHSRHDRRYAGLHRNVLAIALANKLARIACAILDNGRAFECVKTNAPRPA